MSAPLTIERWTRLSSTAAAAAAGLVLLAASAPAWLGGAAIDRLVVLLVYVLLAVTWNALAGYGGLVSIGQQAFFGLGAYAVIRLSAAGLPVYAALPLAAALVALLALPLAFVMLRLRGGELAIGAWVVAELAHLLVNLDGLIQGETGTSLIALNTIPETTRHAVGCWMATIAVAVLVGGLFAWLRSREGVAIQAIRDDEAAAASLGVGVLRSKRILYVFAAGGAAMAGALWVVNAISFQPRAYFGVQWSAYMIFMVLIGGIGTFEGPILGALLLFVIETWFGSFGVWYLVGLGATALVFALFFPRGIWGFLEHRGMPRLLFVGYRVVLPMLPSPAE